MRRKCVLPRYFLLLFGTALFVSAGMIWYITASGQKEKAAFQTLEGCVNDKMLLYISQDIAPNEQIVERSDSSPYASLKNQNSDFFGWISIEGTDLSYPVMHTPGKPEYYLHRDFEGKQSQGGVPFLSASCQEGCGNYIIYGHNMRNGSMFSTLLSYASKDFWQEYQTIQFDTLNDEGEYMVISAFYSRVYQQNEEDVFRFYQYADLTVPSVFDEYTKQVSQNALYDTGICAEYGDQLLTLVTCSHHTDNGRFVVVARKQTK